MYLINKIIEVSNRFIKKIISRGIVGIYQTIYILLHRHKQVVILNIREINLLAHYEKIINNLLKDEKIKLILATRYRENLRILSNKYNIKIFNSDALDMTYGRCFSISAQFGSKAPKKSTHINIFHNQPVKYISYSEEEKNKYDYYFAWGDFYRSYLKDVLHIEESRIKLMGCSMLDSLFSANDNIDIYKTKLGIDPEKKTLLYAPSWNPGLSLRVYGDELIKKLSEQKDVNIIVRLHPASLFHSNHPNYEYFTGGTDWNSKINQWVESYNNVFNGNIEESSINIIKVADLLVTDISSIAFDFYIQQKPVIYIHCEEYIEYSTSDYGSKVFGSLTRDDLINNDYINAGRNYGIIVYDIKKINEAIENTLYNGEYDKHKINDLSERLLVNKGSATREIHAFISDTGNLK